MTDLLPWQRAVLDTIQDWIDAHPDETQIKMLLYAPTSFHRSDMGALTIGLVPERAGDHTNLHVFLEDPNPQDPE